MDRSAKEVLEIEQSRNDATDTSILELSDLQLVFVGGGSADPIYH